ncbi:glycosyltransferase family 4 protein [Sedimentibacter sp. MB31-C6]|uniref:glycosyltransferase family 4 protein n=1 Tax=Sedimentibacter sp. MB31-C6 TaxID=3109366 RepID=UPI002DDD9952|nr:glycosyltransferase family 4 protein [Sedimentibacter sp. MB36-C1]WSI03560.1 glycosyltransferase family 4 protein [Sedimentibacter sp. MB36-C1]
MKKKIWIMNHYATNMYFNEGGRHYWFAENLIKRGYGPTLFCANTRHNSKNVIELDKRKYIVKNICKIPFVFVKTSMYTGNGKSRLWNIIEFFINLSPVAKEYAKLYGEPDIIIASSVHPLTLVAGIQIAKKYNIPCICEVRDLWPLSLVEMGRIKNEQIVTKILYKLEHWIYKKADSVIFTMEGGKDYILDKGWNNEIDLSKIYNINNGVDFDKFKERQKYKTIEDTDLDDDSTFKVIYTGSIRAFNNINYLVDVARLINKEESYKNIKFIIYGDGDDRKNLEEICKKENLNNIVFKGSISKEYIPYILGKSNLNMLIYRKDLEVFKYGGSQNKLFEYFASGKPIISNIKINYDLIEKYNCGETIYDGDAIKIKNCILKFYNMSKQEYDFYCNNSIKAARDYDFKALTNKLEKVIENTMEGRKRWR